ncbi:MAG: glycosyl transferase, partial [Candidatus Omnitrophica bacterium]|nr:glycosyl transferase [Candidatus Omnitrophota bacterium]
WMQKVAFNWICGIRASKDGLVIDPCIPRAWKGFKAQRTFRNATYAIEVKNPKGISKGIASIMVDGVKIDGAVIKPHKDGRCHTVVVIMG